MPQTQLVVLADREGDIYELHEAAGLGLANLHLLVRAQHDRNLESHEKLWAGLARQPVGQTRSLQVPRRAGQPARTAHVEVRWAPVTISAPATGPKHDWPPLPLWARPPAGAVADGLESLGHPGILTLFTTSATWGFELQLQAIVRETCEQIADRGLGGRHDELCWAVGGSSSAA